MKKPTTTRIVTTSFTPAEFNAFMRRTTGQSGSVQCSAGRNSLPTLGRLFDPNWAEADLMAQLREQLPLHIAPMYVEFLQTALQDQTVRRAYLQPRLHASQMELLTPWKAAIDGAARAYLSPLLLPGEPDLAFVAAFMAPISRFTLLLPSVGMEEGADESAVAGLSPQRPNDANVLRAELLRDALLQLARRNMPVADTLSSVLNLNRAPFHASEDQVARLSAVVALAVMPLHNLWPVTAQERALSVKYLQP